VQGLTNGSTVIEVGICLILCVLYLIARIAHTMLTFAQLYTLMGTVRLSERSLDVRCDGRPLKFKYLSSTYRFSMAAKSTLTACMPVVASGHSQTVVRGIKYADIVHASELIISEQSVLLSFRKGLIDWIKPLSANITNGVSNSVYIMILLRSNCMQIANI